MSAPMTSTRATDQYQQSGFTTARQQGNPAPPTYPARKNPLNLHQD